MSARLVEVKVRDHQLRRMRRKRGESGGAVGKGKYLMPLLTQQLSYHLQHCEVVIDQ